MEVVFYQIFIASTIVFANYIRRGSVLWVCGFWTLFTAANLFFPPLIFIQLTVIWGTFWLLRNNEAKTQRIDELQELTSTLPREARNRVAR